MTIDLGRIKLEPLPMREAQEFWKDKVQMRPKDFKALADEAKVKAFAVSGIAKGDQLKTVFDALQRAIDEGTSFDQFKKECGDIFERRGWTGKRAWRVDNIFRTNIQTAYNVGRYKQLNEDVDVLPYWMYSAVNDSRTRPEHLAMNGRVWPANHPTWDTWYPPNGYRCRCSVIALTENQVKNRGAKVEEKDPTGRLIEPVSPVSGERMPAKQLLPDPGFERNPGKDYWGDLGTTMQDRLATYPAQLATAVLKELSRQRELKELLEKQRRERGGNEQ
jgi:SPP1 gp7 family putative phage head morphogenesis protein